MAKILARQSGTMRLTRHGLFDLTGNLLESYERYQPLVSAEVEDLETLIDAVEKKRREVHDDPTLTTQGKDEALQRLADFAETAIEEIRVKRQWKLDEDLAKAKSKLPTSLPIKHPNAALQPEVQELRAIEIRSAWRAMGDAQRTASLRTAARDGDREALFAAQSTPKALPLFSSDDLEGALEIWIEAAFEDAVLGVRVVSAALAVYTTNLQQAKKTLRVTPEDKLLKLIGA